jgi:hypothetical protein
MMPSSELNGCVGRKPNEVQPVNPPAELSDQLALVTTDATARAQGNPAAEAGGTSARHLGHSPTGPGLGVAITCRVYRPWGLPVAAALQMIISTVYLGFRNGSTSRL